VFRALLDSAPDAVVVIDAEGVIVLVNEQTEKLFGYEREDLLGEPVEALIPERFGNAHQGHRRRYVADPRRRPMGAGLELAGRRADGTEFPVDISLSSIVTQDGGTLAMAFIRDISERHAAEAVLASLHAYVANRAEELERRNREIVMVSEMGNLLQSCASSEEAYDVLARFARRLFSADSGAIFIRRDANLLEPVANWGELGGEQPAFGSEGCWALRRGLIHVGGDSQLQPRCGHVGDLSSDYVCVPMMAQSQSMGVVHLRRRSASPAAIDRASSWDSTLSLATALAEHVALALANIQLRDTLRTQSIRDPLTDLFNRRFFDDYVARELRRANRSGSPISILMLDIDHFKQFNDDFGHATGDVVLVELGRLLKSQLRGADVACRFGGEEFALVLPDCSIIAAARKADELLERVRDLNVAGTVGAITLSIGVSAFPVHGLSVQPLIEAADVALYAAKRSGRGCVEVHPVGDLADTARPTDAEILRAGARIISTTAGR
jgi:diguanylate cyclase (GGDEF)-like protein/PAS domain S-box-containing protein